MTNDIKITDINTVYEIHRKGKEATQEEVWEALKYIHYIADCHWPAHEWFYTTDDYIHFCVLLEDYGIEHWLQFLSDTKQEDFEEDEYPELHEYCLFVDFAMRSKEFILEYTEIDTDFDNKPILVPTGNMAHGPVRHDCHLFDNIYRCYLDFDPYAAVKRQISMIKPEKRPFFFYMFHKYLIETKADEKVVELLEKCLLAAANELAEITDIPEYSWVNMSEASIEVDNYDTLKFPLEATNIIWVENTQHKLND